MAVLLLLTPIVSFVLGMGMPTVGVYVLTATLVAPALVQLGVKPMAAHMFVMYYGMLSMITPPVALASYAAANIARTSGWTTSWQSVAFGWSAFVLPFLFVGSPSLLFDAPLHVVAWDFARTGLGIYAGCVAVIGYSFGGLGMLGRLLYGALSLLVLIPPLLQDGRSGGRPAGGALHRGARGGLHAPPGEPDGAGGRLTLRTGAPRSGRGSPAR